MLIMQKYSYGHIKENNDDNLQSKKCTSSHINNYKIKMKANLNDNNIKLPYIFDLRTTLKNGLPKSQQPYNQENIGSCTAQACAFLYVFEQLKQNNSCPIMPSRLDIYYNSRYYTNTINDECGSTISSGLYSLISGVCIEKEWPYITKNFKLNTPQNCQARKEIFKGLSFSSIDIDYNLPQNEIINELKKTLVRGYPIIFGFNVYESFESEWLINGIMPIPKPDEARNTSHCVVAIGYDDEKQSFLIRNSWGTNWGISTDGGHFYMPYSFIADEKHAYEFKILVGVTNPTSFKKEYKPCYLNPYNVEVTPQKYNMGETTISCLIYLIYFIYCYFICLFDLIIDIFIKTSIC